jgi:hypothetical protein
MNSLLRRYAAGAEVMPDEIFESTAREICRFERMSDCSAILARWSVDHPDSDRWRSMLSSLRKKARSKDSDLASPQFDQLSALSSGRITFSDDAEPAHLEARGATEFFLDHYHHVVPFDRRVIEEIWSRCNGEDCEAERAKIDEMLRGLDASASR